MIEILNIAGEEIHLVRIQRVDVAIENLGRHGVVDLGAAIVRVFEESGGES